MKTKQNVYLDYASATPVDSRVLKATQPYWQDDFFNPSALYLSAKKVGHDVLAARTTIAGLIGARPSEIIFTAGGTESDNLAISGIMAQHPEGNVVVSAIEHDAVIAAAKQFTHKFAPVDAAGTVDISKLESLIDDKTVLLSIMYANNEIGSIQPITKIGQLITKIRSQRQKSKNTTPLYFHTDASQAANYLDIHVHRLGVDLLTLNGGKIYGPKQTGVLFVRAGVELSPIILGGGQERNVRSGTENVPGIIGLARALELAQKSKRSESKRLTAIQSQTVRDLSRAIPSIVFNGPAKSKLPNIIHLTIPGTDNERLVMALDESGFMCATGSACGASSDEPSHVLAAIGLPEEAIRSSVRVTMGRPTTEADMQNFVRALTKIISDLN